MHKLRNVNNILIVLKVTYIRLETALILIAL